VLNPPFVLSRDSGTTRSAGTGAAPSSGSKQGRSRPAAPWGSHGASVICISFYGSFSVLCKLGSDSRMFELRRILVMYWGYHALLSKEPSYVSVVSVISWGLIHV
jgi:hypothetical protein